MEHEVRRIIVCMDGSRAANDLCRRAAALAKRQGAILIGLRCLNRPFPSPPETFARGPGPIHEVLEIQARREQAVIAAARESFEAVVRPLAADVRFRPCWGDDLNIAAFASDGDLLVIGHPRLQDLPDALSADNLLLHSGRPLLVIPSTWDRDIEGRVLIAWNGSQAARQAVDDAAPLVGDGAVATVLVVDEAAAPDATAELMAALQAMKVRASLKTVTSGPGPAATAILAAADEARADLVVLGGYSRSPAVERLFGGVTRALLAAAPRPLLLSHVPDEVREAVAPGAAVAASGVPRPSFR